MSTTLKLSIAEYDQWVRKGLFEQLRNRASNSSVESYVK